MFSNSRIQRQYVPISCFDLPISRSYPRDMHDVRIEGRYPLINAVITQQMDGISGEYPSSVLLVGRIRLSARLLLVSENKLLAPERRARYS